MTDCTIEYANTRNAKSAKRPFWLTLYLNWKVRRKIRQMQQLDDRMLADIGVTRDDVYLASRQPLSVNAADVLTKAKRRQRDKAMKIYL